MNWWTESHGIRLPSLGFGCGGVWGMPWFEEEVAASLVLEAARLEVTYFDTGPTYCGGNAELRLGRVLKRLDGSDIVISTKVGSHVDGSGKIHKDYGHTAVLRSVDESRHRLGRDQIDILLTHGPLSEAQLNSELYDSLDYLKQTGAVRLTGASCDGRVARQLVHDGRVDVLMCTYNDMNIGNGRTIALAKERGMLVIAKSPLGSGALSFPRRPLFSRRAAWYNLRLIARRPKDVVTVTSRRLLSPKGQGLVRPLEFTLGNDFVDCAVVGTTDSKHLHDNLLSSMHSRIR